MRIKATIIGLILGGLALYASSEICSSNNNEIPLSLLEAREVPEIEERIDCHPDPHVNRERCEGRGCIYEELEEEGAPWCYYPSGSGYRLVGEPVENQDGYLAHLVRVDRDSTVESPDSDSHDEIWVQVFMQNNERLRKPANPLYDVAFTSDPSFGIRVYRRDTGELVLDTSLPGFEHGKYYKSLPIRFPEGSNLYGWGENEQYTLAHDMNWHTYGLYGRDQPPDRETNMYGTHPKLTLLDKNGDASGILFLNSAAQELSVTPMPGAIYRTIGGLLDIYIFLGPGPEQVVQQYTKAIGRTPVPPYWALGFHLCRYGYNNISNMQAARNRMVEYGIPQDAQWGDIDIMERQLDFTIDPVNFNGLSSYVDELKEENVRPFDLGEQYGVWIHNPDGSPFIGRVWPNDPVYFPDYSNPRTHDWWKVLIREFYDLIKFDGLWIDMNEPANFVAGDLNKGCADNKLNFPDYTPHIRIDKEENSLSDKTMCPDAVQHKGSHYYLHNMFGWFQSKPTLDAVKEATGKRGLVLSRSTYVGSGNWVAHWLGDNFSNWANLKNSIIGMLQFNQFGIPFVGADICGFIGDTNAELCARWQQLGAFYPFSRNHNALGTIEQDPGVFGEEVARITAEALTIRYALLPYLYTLFYQHYLEFMWGKALMISPVLEEGAVSRNIYLSPETRWYAVSDLFDIDKIDEEEQLGWIEFPAPSDVIPIHMRGGAAVTVQQPGLTTVESRKGEMGLIFALDENFESAGHLFYDDGEELNSVDEALYLQSEYTFAEYEINYDVLNNGWAPAGDLRITSITVLGLRSQVAAILVNGEEFDHSYQNLEKGNFIIYLLNLPINSSFNIKLGIV